MDEVTLCEAITALGPGTYTGEEIPAELETEFCTGECDGCATCEVTSLQIDDMGGGFFHVEWHGTCTGCPEPFSIRYFSGEVTLCGESPASPGSAKEFSSVGEP